MNTKPMRSSLACLATAMLGGCMNMSGLSGSSSYGCKAPEGVTCDSVSGTYANALANNLPSQRQPSGTPAANEPTATPATEEPTPRSTPLPATNPLPMPLRSSARVLRLWFKPWEDADHDLYDQGYVYVQVEGGQWQIEHVQRQIREAYAPRGRRLQPPPDSATPESRTKDGREPAPVLKDLKGTPRRPSPERPAASLLAPANGPDVNE